MAQAVIQKTSPEAICLECGFIVGLILEYLGINYNNIIFGIPNFIPSPSNLRYVVNKYCGDTFTSISGFVCNYPCRMSCNKGEHARLGCECCLSILIMFSVLGSDM